MKNQSTGRFATLTAVAGLAVFFSAPQLAIADSGSDAFDRQTSLLAQQLRRDEIVIDTSATSATTAPRSLGAAGPAGDTRNGRSAYVDTGSRWFNSYVDQLNQQLQTRTELGDR